MAAEVRPGPNLALTTVSAAETAAEATVAKALVERRPPWNMTLVGHSWLTIPAASTQILTLWSKYRDRNFQYTSNKLGQ